MAHLGFGWGFLPGFALAHIGVVDDVSTVINLRRLPIETQRRKRTIRNLVTFSISMLVLSWMGWLLGNLGGDEDSRELGNLIWLASPMCNCLDWHRPLPVVHPKHEDRPVVIAQANLPDIPVIG